MTVSILDNYLHDYERYKREADDAYSYGELYAMEDAIAQMNRCTEAVMSEASGMEYEVEEYWSRWDELETRLDATNEL
jgi:hypothetical protein